MRRNSLRSAKLRVLHLASFSGNIGDNASHSGFRPWFEDQANREVSWVELEIRRFNRKELAFTKDFAVAARAADLVVIGGGNYLELWPPDSETGTTLDIPSSILDQIDTPIFFNALGVDAGQGISEKADQAFPAFIRAMTGSENRLLSVRNDGSYAQLQSLVHDLPDGVVHQVPDPGFFQTMSTTNSVDRRGDGLSVGINLAMDMAAIRYAGGNRLSYEEFCLEFAKLLTDLTQSRQDCCLVFFPHIFSDVRIIADVIDLLPDELRRTSVSIAPFENGAGGAKRTLDEYRQVDLVMGMRFHANVCPIGMNIPTLGMVNYPQISLLYSELKRPFLASDVTTVDGLRGLLQNVQTIVDDLPRASRGVVEVMSNVREMRKTFEPALSGWLELNRLR